MVDREMIFNEKGASCVICGAEENLHVHHVDGDRNNNALENLEPVCSGCHGRIHNGDLPEWAEKLLPKEQRNRRKSVQTSPEDTRRLKIIQKWTEVDNEANAYRYAVKSTVDRLSSMDRRLELIHRLRIAPEESEAEIEERALAYQVKMEHQIEKLLQRAVEQGSVTPQEIAELLDVAELPVDFSISWSVGRDK